jgi:hypothetical protein
MSQDFKKINKHETLYSNLVVKSCDGEPRKQF